MLKNNKQFHIFNPQILSSSGDTIRDVLALSVTIDEQGEINLPAKTGKPASFSALSSYSFSNTLFESSPDFFYTATYSLRLVGDEEKVKSDKHWLSYVFGGSFNDEVLPGVYTPGTFLDHQHSEDVPYTVMETKLNNSFDTSSPNTISIKPFMASFYSKYNSYISGLRNTNDIPNMYEFLQQKTDKTQKEIKNSLNMEIPNNTFDGSFSSGDLLEHTFVCSSDIYEEIDELNNYAQMFSFSNIFDLRFEKTGQLVNSVEVNNFSNRFIKVLKDGFFAEDGAPSFDVIPFSVLAKEIGQSQEIENTSLLLDLKVIDAMDMLQYSFQDYNTENINFKYLLDDSEKAYSQYNSNSIRRLEKTIPTVKQIRSLKDFVENIEFLNSFATEPLNANSKYNEVVAYRLEKIGDPATGDDNTQKPIQNFWFLNSESVEEFAFHDNQILYGEQYTYNVYKYVFIGGLEYVYDNLVVSKTIADLSSDGDTSTSGWCLEIFNPETGEPAAPLVETTTISELGNTFSSEAQINSFNKYIADLRLTLRPSLKIVEVPIFTKNVTILDAPTNKTGVKPFYYLDNSRKIGFTNRYLPHSLAVFPTAINSTEEQYRNTFLSSYDLMSNEDITLESVSMPSEMQIFRLDSRPQSLKDFDENLISTVSLKTENHDSYFTDKTVVDKVKLNTKYYYLFRIVNELGSPAHSSQVIEAELTDDGGYRFATFDVIFENELPEPIFSNPTKGVKKLFNIVPNITNITLDDSEVDYSQPALSQLNKIKFGDPSQDLVWDKKYKIRVTSKKTGKKLDINLTFKMDR
jgi:hypothetical protein